MMGLNELSPGQRCTVVRLTHTGALRRRLLDLGFVAETAVECLGRSPGGDPTAFLVRGAVIALRSADAARILVARP